jgi:hypothetical protein
MKMGTVEAYFIPQIPEVKMHENASLKVNYLNSRERESNVSLTS